MHPSISLLHLVPYSAVLHLFSLHFHPPIKVVISILQCQFWILPQNLLMFLRLQRNDVEPLFLPPINLVLSKWIDPRRGIDDIRTILTQS